MTRVNGKNRQPKVVKNVESDVERQCSSVLDEMVREGGGVWEAARMKENRGRVKTWAEGASAEALRQNTPGLLRKSRAGQCGLSSVGRAGKERRWRGGHKMLAPQVKGRRWNFILIMVARLEAFQKERDMSYAGSRFPHTNVNTHMKTCSTSLTIIETHVKSTRSYHLTPVRTAFVKDKTQQMWVRMWGKGNPYMLLVECKLVQSLQKTVWEFLKKFNNWINMIQQFHSSVYIQRHWNQCLEEIDMCSPLFIAALFPVAKIWKQPESISGWVK